MISLRFNLSTVVWYLALSPHNEKSWIQIQSGVFVCRLLFMSSSCLCVFSLGTLAFSHGPKTCMALPIKWLSISQGQPCYRLASYPACLSPYHSWHRLQSGFRRWGINLKLSFNAGNLHGEKSPEHLQHLFFFEEYQSLWHDAFCAIFGTLSCVELLLTGHGAKYFLVIFTDMYKMQICPAN